MGRSTASKWQYNENPREGKGRLKPKLDWGKPVAGPKPDWGDSAAEINRGEQRDVGKGKKKRKICYECYL